MMSCLRVLNVSLCVLMTFSIMSLSVTMPTGAPSLIMITAPILFDIIFSTIDETVSEDNAETGGLLMTDSTEAINPTQLLKIYLVPSFIF
jgi:hypothetical protein